MNFAPDANPIKAFARRGETTLTFPTSHSMNRFASALSTFALLGKLGDEVSFVNLPSSVQNADIAEAFNALSFAEVSESCGSPGEVANNPLAGHHFTMQGNGNGAIGNWGDVYFNGYPNGYHGYGQMIHFHLAMHATDQLRQRAAHALLQIYVISFTGTDHNWNTEIFINFFEILVRNAFGSLRTILKEVSYNGLMAGYLTFQNSESLAAGGTVRAITKPPALACSIALAAAAATLLLPRCCCPALSSALSALPLSICVWRSCRTRTTRAK